MGAFNIDAILAGHLTRRELADWHTEQRARDEMWDEREEEDRDVYSGDWRTLDEIRLVSYSGTYADAPEYCLDHSEKWSYAVAVHTVDTKGNPVTVVSGWAAT